MEKHSKGLPTNRVSATEVYAAVNAQAEAAKLLVARIQGLWERCGRAGDVPRISLAPHAGALSKFGQSPGYGTPGVQRNSTPLKSLGLFASPW